jgi:hypothetical protein
MVLSPSQIAHLLFQITNSVIHALTNGDDHHHGAPPTMNGDRCDGDEERSRSSSKKAHNHDDFHPTCATVVSNSHRNIVVPYCPCDADIDQLHQMAIAIEGKDASRTTNHADSNVDEDEGSIHVTSHDNDGHGLLGNDESEIDESGVSVLGADEESGFATSYYREDNTRIEKAKKRKLLISSINTAVAISAHNFPEVQNDRGDS